MEKSKITVSQYYPGLDILKFVMAILIVCTHTNLLKEYAEMHTLLQHAFDMAVPVFFSVSAYIFYKKLLSSDETEQKQTFKRQLKHQIIFYVVWWVLMLPMTCKTFFAIANYKEILYAVIFRSTFGGYWFIKALIINTIILYYSKKWRIEKIIGLISLVLYLILTANYSYSFVSLPVGPYFSFYYHTIFFFIGAFLAKDKCFISVGKTWLMSALLLVFGLSFTFSYCEYLSRLIYPFLLIPIFLHVISSKIELCKKMRVCSILFYVMQFFLIWVYGLIAKKYESECGFLQMSLVQTIIILVCLTVVSLLIIRLERNFKYLKYLH